MPARARWLQAPMLDEAVLPPGLSPRQAEEDIVVYPELGADPAGAGLGRDPVAPALWHQLRHSSRDIPSALPRMRLERSILLVKRVLAEWPFPTGWEVWRP